MLNGERVDGLKPYRIALRGVGRTFQVIRHGEKIAEGPPGVIQADERVIEAYFGR